MVVVSRDNGNTVKSKQGDNNQLLTLFGAVLHHEGSVTKPVVVYAQLWAKFAGAVVQMLTVGTKVVVVFRVLNCGY